MSEVMPGGLGKHDSGVPAAALLVAFVVVTMLPIETLAPDGPCNRAKPADRLTFVSIIQGPAVFVDTWTLHGGGEARQADVSRDARATRRMINRRFMAW
jgi:hypothetical protein